MERTTENYDGGILANGRRISNLRYADDTVIFAENIGALNDLAVDAPKTRNIIIIIENIEDFERIMLQLQRGT